MGLKKFGLPSETVVLQSFGCLINNQYLRSAACRSPIFDPQTIPPGFIQAIRRTLSIPYLPHTHRPPSSSLSAHRRLLILPRKFLLSKQPEPLSCLFYRIEKLLNMMKFSLLFRAGVGMAFPFIELAFFTPLTLSGKLNMR